MPFGIDRAAMGRGGAQMASVLSWNVLYREYEEELHPESKILESYPDENERVAEIVSLLKRESGKKTVMCLQECSSAVCDALTVAFAATHRVFTYRIRGDEHLATVAPKGFELVWGGPHATSNGYLVVRGGGICVINCHLVPRRYIRASAMEHLRRLLRVYPGVVVVAGDFNEEHRRVKEELTGHYTCPHYGKTYRGRSIDQIVFSGDGDPEKRLIETGALSDHNAISLTLR